MAKLSKKTQSKISKKIKYVIDKEWKPDKKIGNIKVADKKKAVKIAVAMAYSKYGPKRKK